MVKTPEGTDVTSSPGDGTVQGPLKNMLVGHRPSVVGVGTLEGTTLSELIGRCGRMAINVALPMGMGAEQGRVNT